MKPTLRLVVLGAVLGSTYLSLPLAALPTCPTPTCSVLVSQCRDSGGKPTSAINPSGQCLDTGNVARSYGLVSCPGYFSPNPIACTYR